MSIEKFKQVKKVLWIILIANWIVALVKIIFGTVIKSASMTADGFHSLSDGTSNIVGLVGISLASKPQNKTHPYGHKKYEVISSMFIGGMLLLLAIKVISTSISKFINPVTPTITNQSLIALILTLAINIFVCVYENNKGKELSSHILISDSMHTRSDILVSIGVIFTLIGIKLGLPSIIDPIASLVVCGFILHSSYEIFKSSIAILADKAIVDEMEIIKIIKEIEEVKGIHHIRSRGSENDIYIDMHILVDPKTSVEKSHILSHKIERKIQKEISKNIQVITHIEPFYEEI